MFSCGSVEALNLELASADRQAGNDLLLAKRTLGVPLQPLFNAVLVEDVLVVSQQPSDESLRHEAREADHAGRRLDLFGRELGLEVGDAVEVNLCFVVVRLVDIPRLVFLPFSMFSAMPAALESPPSNQSVDEPDQPLEHDKVQDKASV
uniref:Uncharacterized protein n=1 Tax=Euplotes harpa TaxID=151035 RepID=A0A7S3J9F8_9SPIT